MAKNSTTRRRSRQSDRTKKPCADYPLTAHKNGQWCKLMRPLGADKWKMFYFGPLDDPKTALDRYLDKKDDIMAGRPVANHTDGLRVEDAVNAFLDSKKRKMDRGELVEGQYKLYRATCKKILAQFGPGRTVETLVGPDFGRLRDSFYVRTPNTRHQGPVSPNTIAGEIRRTKAVFKFAFDGSLIEKPIRYGQDFDPPTRATIRDEKNGSAKKCLTRRTFGCLSKRQTRPCGL